MPGHRSRSCPATGGPDPPEHDYVALAALLACAAQPDERPWSRQRTRTRTPAALDRETAGEIPAAVPEELARAADCGIDSAAMLCQVVRLREWLYLSIAAQKM
jgi:hypothetical protein